MTGLPHDRAGDAGPACRDHAATALRRAEEARRLAVAGHADRSVARLTDAVAASERMEKPTREALAALDAIGAALAALDVFALSETGRAAFAALARGDARRYPAVARPALRVVAPPPALERLAA